jgi:hypothetical protein
VLVEKHDDRLAIRGRSVHFADLCCYFAGHLATAGAHAAAAQRHLAPRTDVQSSHVDLMMNALLAKLQMLAQSQASFGAAAEQAQLDWEAAMTRGTPSAEASHAWLQSFLKT